jgi:transcriptional regulator GlxA family with amidase domain
MHFACAKWTTWRANLDIDYFVTLVVMKKLVILVPNGPHNLSSVVDTYLFFTKANAYWQGNGRKPRFEIQLASTTKKVNMHGGLFAVQPHTTIHSIRKASLVIIPAVLPDFSKTIRQSKAMVDWIAKQRRAGAEIASICTGAFMLASTGLLEGKRCSTHWHAANEFREMFPDVNLVENELITDEDGLYTNGGAFSFLNFLLYLVEKYYDRTTAIFCSKMFQIDIDRYSQSQFRIFSGQKRHGDDVVRKAQTHFEKNAGERISITKLSSSFAVSRRNFDRRFIRATGNTPGEYLQRVKVEAAKKAFESSGKTVNEVMYDVGYSDPKAFRSTFKRITGISPIDYRNKYNRQAAI